MCIITWAIESNLHSSGAVELQDACNKLQVPYVNVYSVPFSNEPPEIDVSGHVVFYGATSCVTNIYKTKKYVPGVFFDEDNFRMSSYLRNWEMLNSDAETTTLAEFSDRNEDPNRLFFIRPDKDLKEFAGEVVRFGDFSSWVDKVSLGGGIFGIDCEIVVAEPVGISNEWRIFVVNGKAITGSHYRSYLRLDVHPEVPQEVISFAEDMAKIWSPAEVFALDVGRSGSKLYVIEANCMNSSGLYSSNAVDLVSNINSYIQFKYS